MTVRIEPGRSFEVFDQVRMLRLEWVEGGSLLVTVSADGQTAEVVVEPREVRQLSGFVAGAG